MNYITKRIANKNLVWFHDTFSFFLLEDPAFDVFEKGNQGINKQQIVKFISEKYGISKKESSVFISDVQNVLNNTRKIRELPDEHNYNIPSIPRNFYSIKYYKFINSTFTFFYTHLFLEVLVHPYFMHLEIKDKIHNNHSFHLIFEKESFALYVNNSFKGKWTKTESQLLKGRIFMEMINLAYNKTETDWMATIHASAISDGKKCIIFPAESGSGKSTLSAILLSNGFKVLSDDIVAIETSSSEVFHFPTAISIKSGAYELLKTNFPELKNAKEYYWEETKKFVRYLSPTLKKSTFPLPVPAKAIVFVKYDKQELFSIKKIEKDEALIKIIPDSWISPLLKNAETFLDWIIQIPCYQLTYSDNGKMVDFMKEFMKNEQ